MSRERQGAYGTYTSDQPGLWFKKGGVTKIEKHPSLGAGWWVSTPKEGFINVYRTLREAISMRWD